MAIKRRSPTHRVVEGLTLIERNCIEEDIKDQITELVRNHTFRGRFEDGGYWSLIVSTYVHERFSFDIDQIK